MCGAASDDATNCRRRQKVTGDVAPVDRNVLKLLVSTAATIRRW